MFLRDRRIIKFEEYETLRSNYVSANKYLPLYELAPRVFGDTWGHKHIMDLDGRFKKPDKLLDPGYDGHYDLWIDGVRIEVKASRAVKEGEEGSLSTKALRYGSTDPFWMNFQQIKLDTCDAFIFVGVWVDRIIYWVLSNDEVKNNHHLSHQHAGGVEYQVGITADNIRDFDEYRVGSNEVGNRVIQKGQGGRTPPSP